MFSLETSTIVPYDPAAAFAALATVEATLRWQVGVVGVRRARAAPRTLIVGYRALGVRYALRARVTAFDPPISGGSARFAYHAEHAAFTLDVALGLMPALGGTRLAYQIHLTTHPAADGDAGPEAVARQAAFRRLLARRAPRDLTRLEHYLARRLHPVIRAARTDAASGLHPGGPKPVAWRLV